MTYTPDQTKDLEAALLAGNSNPDFVGELIADFVRKLFGASISTDSFGAVTLATVTFQQVVAHTREFSPTDLRSAMAVAEESLRLDFGDPLIEAAQSGANVLIAKSAKDSFSPARTSKAKDRFRHDMRRALGTAEP